MSTAIAMAPSPAPHDRPSFGKQLNASAGPTSSASEGLSPSAIRTTLAPPPSIQLPTPTPATASSSASASSAPPPADAVSPKTTVDYSSPPTSARNTAPRIIVKKEPSSPPLPQSASSRHRPRRLDLSNHNNVLPGATTAPRPQTSRELGVQDLGLACLSPGLVTQNPTMNDTMARSLDIQKAQRQIIEARLQQSAKGDGPGRDSFHAKTPGFARKRGAPPGLSIVAPSHEQFASERVVQSAPLGQSFTGRDNHYPLTRHITNQPPNQGGNTHVHHHVPALQTNNRLPPIADVFGQGLTGHHEPAGSSLYPSQSRPPPLASPGRPPPQSTPMDAPISARMREFKTAEEAQAELAGGRPELLPKIVHYGSRPPPPVTTSPARQHQQHQQQREDDMYQRPPSYLPESSQSASGGGGSGGSGGKRRRAEYEDGQSPPALGNGRAPTRSRGPFGEPRDSPETQRAKRERFLRLCEEAWDLFHS